MSLLHKKPWWQKIFLSRITLAILMVASVVLSFAVYDRYVVEREMAARRESREAELAREVERHAILKEKVEYLNNEDGMEAEIRRHFDVALEGEQVVIIVGENSEATTTAPLLVGSEEEKRSFWQIIWPW